MKIYRIAGAIALACTASASVASPTPACEGKDIVGNCLPGAYDPNNAAFALAAVLTPDVPAVSARSLGLICTAAGNVALTLSGGSALTIPAAVGFTILPLAVTKIGSSGTTATCTAYNLG